MFLIFEKSFLQKAHHVVMNEFFHFRIGKQSYPLKELGINTCFNNILWFIVQHKFDFQVSLIQSSTNKTKLLQFCQQKFYSQRTSVSKLFELRLQQTNTKI
jgi:hypothetical protein